MSEDQFNRLFNYMQDRFDDIDHRFDAIDVRFEAVDARFEIMDKKIDDIHNTVMNSLDALSGDLADVKDELAVVGYKVTRLEEWVTAFKY